MSPDQIARSIEATPGVLRTLLSSLDDSLLRIRPAPGEWNVLEVIAHLIDADGPAFRERILTIAGGAEAVPSYDASPTWNDDDVDEWSLDDLLDRLEAERSASAEMLRLVDPELLDRAAPYRSMGDFTANDFVQEWVFHDADHLQQILEIIKSVQLAAVSPTMRAALDPSS